jgi:hypothetical protein
MAGKSDPGKLACEKNHRAWRQGWEGSGREAELQQPQPRRLMPPRIQKSNRRWTQMDTDFQEITPHGEPTRQMREKTCGDLFLSAFIRVHLRLKIQIETRC